MITIEDYDLENGEYLVDFYRDLTPGFTERTLIDANEIEKHIKENEEEMYNMYSALEFDEGKKQIYLQHDMIDTEYLKELFKQFILDI